MTYEKNFGKKLMKKLKKKRKKKKKRTLTQNYKKRITAEPYPYFDPEGESGETSGPGGG